MSDIPCKDCLNPGGCQRRAACSPSLEEVQRQILKGIAKLVRHPEASNQAERAHSLALAYVALTDADQALNAGKPA